MTDKARPIDPGVDIGHVHLKVSDLERSLAFYCDVLGLSCSNGTGRRLRLFRRVAITTISD